jgi:hypothetical protein
MQGTTGLSFGNPLLSPPSLMTIYTMAPIGLLVAAALSPGSIFLSPLLTSRPPLPSSS